MSARRKNEPEIPERGRRLRDQRERRGLTLEKVGAVIGKSPQAAEHWETKGSVPRDPEDLLAVARFVGISAEYWITGADLSEQTENITVRPIAYTKGQIVRKLTALQAISADTKTGQVYGYTHFPCSADSFILTIEDKSNAPLYTPGDEVVIDPKLDFQPEDMVFGTYGPDRRPFFRKIESIGNERFVLRALNASWPPYEGAIDQDFVILGVMSEHCRPRR